MARSRYTLLEEPFRAIPKNLREVAPPGYFLEYSLNRYKSLVVGSSDQVYWKSLSFLVVDCAES